MKRNVSLNQRAPIGNKSYSINGLLKFFRRNNRNLVVRNGVVTLVNRRGGENIVIDVADLNEDFAFTLLSSELGKAPGLFNAIYKYNKNLSSKELKHKFVEDLLEDSSNYNLVPDVVLEDNGEPLLAVIKKDRRKTRDMVKNLNADQAKILVDKNYEIETATLNSGRRPKIRTVRDIWNSMPENIKYTPEVFSNMVSREGVPLITGLKQFRKYVNKNKLIKEISKRPERINDFVKAFGYRTLFSDTALVKEVGEAIGKKALKTTKPDEVQKLIDAVEILKQRSNDYKKDVEVLKEVTVAPTGVTKTEYNKFLKQSNKNQSDALKAYQLTADEKNFVLDSVLKLNYSDVVSGKKSMEEFTADWLKEIANTKKHNGKKINVNLDKMFLDTKFMQEMFTKTLPAASVHNFYYGNKDKNGKIIMHQTDVYNKLMNDFSGVVYAERNKVLDKTKQLEEVNAMKQMKAVEKRHGAIIEIVGNQPKLKGRAKDRILNNIEKGKYSTPKGIEKFNKLIDKQGDKLLTDNEFVGAMLGAIESSVQSSAFNTKVESVEKSIKKSVETYKPLFDRVIEVYDKNLEGIDEITSKLADLDEILEDNKDFEKQQEHAAARRQKVKASKIEKEAESKKDIEEEKELGIDGRELK